MKCEHCLIHEATFHYRSNINGQIAEQHLCTHCAQAIEGGLFAHAPVAPMDALFGGGLFGLTPQRTGRPVCVPYKSAPPVGDAALGVPLIADDSLKRRRALNALRQEMQTAIEREHFERAAELRDEIHRMETET